MKKAFNILILIVVVLSSCGPRLVPVSSNSEHTTTIDSTHLVTTAKKDSSFFRETVTEKTLPGASIGITLSRAQLDSLINSLGTLPTAVTRTIYYQDPQSKAQLKILFDSLGRIQIKCAALDQKYFEKSTQEGHYIESLQSELVAKNKEINQLSERVLQLQQSKWKEFWNGIGAKLWWIWLLLGFGLCFFLYSKLSSIKSIFKS